MYLKIYYRPKNDDGLLHETTVDDIPAIAHICADILAHSQIAVAYSENLGYLIAETDDASEPEVANMREIRARLAANGYDVESSFFMPSVTFINCTEHDIDIVDDRNVLIRRYPEAVGMLVRVATHEVEIATIDGVNITRTVFGKVENLPPIVPNTFYIVSMAVATASPDRPDFVGPNSGKTALRDKGRMLAARTLVQYHDFDLKIFEPQYIAGVSYTYDIMNRWTHLHRAYEDAVEAIRQKAKNTQFSFELDGLITALEYCLRKPE